MSSLFIGCYTPDRGRGLGITTPDGRIVPAISPSFVITHPRLPVLYAVAEETEGGVAAWSLDDYEPSGTGATGGADPCHLAVSGDHLVTVNYSGGSIAVHALDPDGWIGRRTDLVVHTRHGDHPRQDGPHPHMVRPVSAAAGDTLIVTDLGGDAIYLYHLEEGRLVRDRIVEAPTASGPRHVLRVGDRWLVTTELSAEVLVYDDDWTLVGRVATRPTLGPNDVSELVATATHLYVANRGPDTVSVFTLGGDLPVYVTEIPVGANPRHVTLADGVLYVSSQDADEIHVLRIGADGIPAPESVIDTPSPTCVLVR
jgi:6-phosphogluconolactonase